MAVVDFVDDKFIFGHQIASDYVPIKECQIYE